MQPRHVAMIMDGNGRWAESQGLPRTRGHVEGAEAVRRVVRRARQRGVQWLTLFAFSSQNWGRPSDEVGDLMQLLVDFLRDERQEMLDNGIRLTAIGEAATAHCADMRLVLAVSYDGRRDMVRAVKRLTQLASQGLLLPADVSERQIMSALSTADMPDVDLLVRTSGELRLSGFLPLEACYAELYFADKLWPEFTGEDLDAAMATYTARQRRFGLTGAQLAAAPA
jgi:undecaprenyl diphosphate synthase